MTRDFTDQVLEQYEEIMAAARSTVNAYPVDARPPKQPSALYKFIMTPVFLTTFIISLVIVDIRNTALRRHYHAEDSEPGRMPRWLHRILYRYKPYKYEVLVDENGKPVATPTPIREGMPPLVGPESREEFYHSQQRKLMKMEVVEAFETRRSVMAVLAVFGIGAFFMAWKVASWGIGAVLRAWTGRA